MRGQGNFSEEGQSELGFGERIGIFQADWDKAGQIFQVEITTCPKPRRCEIAWLVLGTVDRPFDATEAVIVGMREEEVM